MTNYDVTVHIERGSSGGEIEDKIEDYLNALDSGKTIRSICATPVGSDNVLVLIIHDS
jgi:hypothetical protein